MERKTFSFTFVIGEEYTNGEDIVKIVGFENSFILINDGRDFNMHIESREFINEWWKTERITHPDIDIDIDKNSI
jgi:hypothetical protein